jgi:hypothetical protein
MRTLAQIEAVSASRTKWHALPQVSLLVSIVATLGWGALLIQMLTSSNSLSAARTTRGRR